MEFGVVSVGDSVTWSARLKGEDAEPEIEQTPTPEKLLMHGVVASKMTAYTQHLEEVSKKAIPEKADTKGLIFTEPMFVPPKQREALATLAFETLGLDGVIMLEEGVCAYAAGEVDETCTIIDLGYNSTRVKPYYEGLTVPSLSVRVDVGGWLVKEKLAKSGLTEQDLRMLEEIPAQPPSQDTATGISELLVHGKTSVVKAVKDMWKTLPEAIHDDVRSTIFITGGLSNIDGLPKRFEKELSPAGGDSYRVVSTPPMEVVRKLCLESFNISETAGYLSREEYDEHGPSRLNVLQPPIR